MGIEIIKGDLFTTDCQVIAHQVNCQGVMGSGVALQVKEKHSRAYERYYQMVMKQGGNVKGRCQLVESNDIQVANLFGQEFFGYDNRQYTDINLLNNALLDLKDQMIGKGLCSVAFPFKMASDRGGANWEDVYELIEIHFGTEFEVKIYKLR